ncbi:hypothetical protein NKJ71_13655 [Mesorhizobium sp. M0050]|uniref:hypothetical protein n=1 Tax=Mesorhizobium sp. M0050 TaxID=2956861 RepID=UPI0033380E95
MFEAESRLIANYAWPTKGAYVAGGAITSVFTGKPINDLDIYFKSREDFETAVGQAYDASWWNVDTSKRAVTFSDNGTIVQYMHFDFFPTAQDIFKAFDYTIVMAAYDYDTKEFVFHDDFLRHNSQRFLRFNAGTRYPLASATRVLKYQQRGYTIGKGDILKIALACRGVKIDTWEDLKDQIGGAYGTKVELVGDSKDFTLDAAIDALTVADDGSDNWISAANDNQPSNALDLFKKLASLKGEPLDEGRYDEDGWLKEAA